MHGGSRIEVENRLDEGGTLLEQLQANGQAALLYTSDVPTTSEQELPYPANPNGSMGGIEVPFRTTCVSSFFSGASVSAAFQIHASSGLP